MLLYAAKQSRLQKLCRLICDGVRFISRPHQSHWIDNFIQHTSDLLHTVYDEHPEPQSLELLSAPALQGTQRFPRRFQFHKGHAAPGQERQPVRRAVPAGEINFRQRPPCVFTADASLRSIRDSRICTPPRSLRPSAVKSWSGAKLVRGVLPLTYFAHSLTAFLAYLLDFYIRPIRAKCAAAKGGFSFKQVLRYLRQQRKNRPLSANVHHAFLCVVSSSSGRSCTTPLVTT